MATYRLTRHARRDLLEIWQRIAEDDESAADRFIDLLIHHFQILGENPRAGRRRDELRPSSAAFPPANASSFIASRNRGCASCAWCTVAVISGRCSTLRPFFAELIVVTPT